MLAATARDQRTKTVRSVCTLPEETRIDTVPALPLDVSTAVDAPLALIVPRFGGDADQVSAGVVIVLPCESTARTVNVMLLFGCMTMSGFDDVTISVSSVAAGGGGGGGGGGAGGAGTVTVAVPDFPSLVAVMVAVPAATPVTTPAVVTVATAASLDDHVMLRPVSVLPAPSSVAADSVSDAPMLTCELPGVTTTLATGTGAGAFTVICAVAVFPSLVAVTVAVPACTAVTTPELLTVAVCGALDAHTMLRPVS